MEYIRKTNLFTSLVLDILNRWRKKKGWPSKNSLTLFFILLYDFDSREYYELYKSCNGEISPLPEDVDKRYNLIMGFAKEVLL